MRYPHWIQVVVLLWMLAGAIATAWVQLREGPKPRKHLTKTRRLQIVRSQDGAAEGRSLGPALRTREKIQQTRNMRKLGGENRGA